MIEAAGPLDLFGTHEPIAERRLLRAGRLTAILEEGNLRDIRFDGVEAVRAVNYLARDAAWGTLRAVLRDVEITETADAFEVRYAALCGDPSSGFAYRMHIRGEAGGRLMLQADGMALADFQTNRTGFVVLHPADAAGGWLIIRHSDGREVATVFPDRIRADQPAFDIAALTDEAAPGLVCTVSMQGDAFEMEDQRNWADASFKTYVRPLSKPRPYTIPKGSVDRQGISIEWTGHASGPSSSRDTAISVRLGARLGRMPDMALFVDEAGLGMAEPVARLAQWLIVRVDPARQPDAVALDEASRFAARVGASLAVELVLDAVSPDPEAEAAMRLLRLADLQPAASLVVPRRELKTRPSATLPAGEQPVGALVHALRRAGLDCPIGAGTPSYFTEFNRNPPDGDLDFVFFSVAAIVHAADDASVMETLDVYPELVASARHLRPGANIWLGPCTIGVRHNPYGADVQPNPDGRRVASARLDPRQGALFGAAYAVGAAARAATAEVATLTLAATAGPFGLADAHGRLRPIHAVQAELANAAGAESVELLFSRPGAAGIAFRTGRGLRALLANLTPELIVLDLPADFRTACAIGPEARLGTVEILDGRLELPAYRTVILSS